MNNKVEILAPAGSMKALKAAIAAGADAVYVGGTRFGARAFAENFTEDVLLEAIDYVHLYGRKLYLTINTLFKDKELEQLIDYLRPYYERGLDAVIIQDLGVMELVSNVFPDLPIHVSTQATVTGKYQARFLKRFHITRIVPARELSLDEIIDLKQDSGLEIECFVHGAICYCYSGQCLLSSMIGGRSGNRGQCAQPCRLDYRFDNAKADSYMSLKDMDAITLIPQLIEAGIDSFKIEGRMKQPGYVYTVVSMYRKYVDLYYSGKKFKVEQKDIAILENAYRRRGYTEGYYRKHNGKDMLSLSPLEGKRETEEIDFVEPDEKKLPIDMEIYMESGAPVKLVLNGLNLGEKIEIYGEIVQTAQSRPLDSERIKKQMAKLGNTSFVLADFSAHLAGNVFVPMHFLNDLRRRAVETLLTSILSPYRRHFSADNASTDIPSQLKELREHSASTPKHRDLPVQLLLHSEEQLRAIKKYAGRLDILIIN